MHDLKPLYVSLITLNGSFSRKSQLFAEDLYTNTAYVKMISSDTNIRLFHTEHLFRLEKVGGGDFWCRALRLKLDELFGWTFSGSCSFGRSIFASFVLSFFLSFAFLPHFFKVPNLATGLWCFFLVFILWIVIAKLPTVLVSLSTLFSSCCNSSANCILSIMNGWEYFELAVPEKFKLLSLRLSEAWPWTAVETASELKSKSFVPWVAVSLRISSYVKERLVRSAQITEPVNTKRIMEKFMRLIHGCWIYSTALDIIVHYRVNLLE